jgi:Tol biopolymer transport system component
LIIFDPDHSEVILDLTDLITSFGLQEAESLRFSAGGDRLAIGSRERFIVIDLSSHARIFEGGGRFPRISPDGRRVAFVTTGHSLIVVHMDNGSQAELLRRYRVDGVGAWSPDQSLLLAGAWTSISLYKRLLAVDTNSGEFAELGRLGEGDFGSEINWIRQSVVSALM